VPDIPARPTLLQRVVLWILGALLFYIVALYPNLLMARFQPDDVVHYGFLKWLAVVFVLYWVASQLFFTERPADTRPGRQTLAVTAAVLLLVGIYSPIVSFSFVGDVDFFRSGYGDGYILLLMTAAALALAVTGRWKQVIVPALGGLAVILWTFLGVQETISDARSGGSPELAGNPHAGLAPATMASIQWEWGWILLFAGSGLLVYSAARRDEVAEAAPPFAAVPVEDEPAAAADETATETFASTPAESATAEPADEGSAEEAAGAPAAVGDEPGTASEESDAAAEESADAIAGGAPEEPAADAAEPASEAATEQPAENAAAEEPATAAAAADETPAPESDAAADETEPAGVEDPEAQAPATEPRAAEAPAPEADVAAADADTDEEPEATPASAAAETESATGGPAPAEVEATAAVEEAEPPSESAGSDAQESEGASSESDQASAEAAQATTGETAAAGEDGGEDESESKPASDAKNE